MNKISQRTITINAIQQVIGSIDGKVELTKEQTSQVLDIIATNLIKHDAISPDALAKFKDVAGVRKGYASALLNDALRKVPELNGGIKYEPKAPGSRTKDAQLIALKQLIAKYTNENDDTKLAAVMVAYDKRINELNVAKAKVVAIDLSVLSEDLQILLTSN